MWAIRGSFHSYRMSTPLELELYLLWNQSYSLIMMLATDKYINLPIEASIYRQIYLYFQKNDTFSFILKERGILMLRARSTCQEGVIRAKSEQSGAQNQFKTDLNQLIKLLDGPWTGTRSTWALMQSTTTKGCWSFMWCFHSPQRVGRVLFCTIVWPSVILSRNPMAVFPTLISHRESSSAGGGSTLLQ